MSCWHVGGCGCIGKGRDNNREIFVCGYLYGYWVATGLPAQTHTELFTCIIKAHECLKQSSILEYFERKVNQAHAFSCAKATKPHPLQRLRSTRKP
eukprot:1157775-Pelagomonas_calceolata.AAC.1